MARHRREMIAGICFLAAALAVLGAEIRLAQRETDALAQRLSLEIARSGGKVPRILQPLLQEGGLDAMTLFDREGRLVHESLNVFQEQEPGLLFSIRSGVRDLDTGREIFHMVVHRDFQAGASRAGAAGLVAALLAAIVHWLAGRRRKEAGAAA